MIKTQEQKAATSGQPITRQAICSDSRERGNGMEGNGPRWIDNDWGQENGRSEAGSSSEKPSHSSLLSLWTNVPGENRSEISEKGQR